MKFLHCCKQEKNVAKLFIIPGGGGGALQNPSKPATIPDNLPAKSQQATLVSLLK